jgi:hypothetical protein
MTTKRVPILDGSDLVPAALLPVGTTSGTVAAGNDSRIVGALPATGGTIVGALTFSDGTTADVTVYRSAANILRTDDTLQIGSAATITFGTSADVNLYRSGANALATDDSFAVGSDLQHFGTNLGVYGATPVAKPTVSGSRGGNAALASLLTALASIGLITNSTSA